MKKEDLEVTPGKPLLKRIMQKEVQDPLAEKILAGEVMDNSVVYVGVAKAENKADCDILSFSTTPPSAN